MGSISLSMVYEQHTKINLSCKNLLTLTRESFDALLRECKQHGKPRKTSAYDLDLKKNGLSDGLEYLEKLDISRLNIGDNRFTLLDYFAAAERLIQLHAFRNSIHTITPKLCQSLHELKVLNLNNNCLQYLPSEIGRLQNLKTLSLNTITGYEHYQSASSG